MPLAVESCSQLPVVKYHAVATMEYAGRGRAVLAAAVNVVNLLGVKVRAVAPNLKAARGHQRRISGVAVWCGDGMTVRDMTEKN